MLLESLGKNVSQGDPPKDSLWDETVLFKTVDGLKWIIWGSGKIASGAIGQKCVPRGPPKDPLWNETVLFKTVIGLKWIIWGSGKIAFGATGQKCVPRGFLQGDHFGLKAFKNDRRAA